MKNNLPIDFEKIIKQVSKVTLKGGVFSKTCAVLIIISVCFSVIAYFANNIYISGGTIALIFILVFVVLLKLLNFADKHPQAAIMEGAEFLIHEQIQSAAKGQPVILDTSDSVTQAERPKLLQDISQKEANLPEVLNQYTEETNNSEVIKSEENIEYKGKGEN